MNKTHQTDSPSTPSPEVQDVPVQLPVELWEAPFERWLRLADHLLRDWPRTSPVPREHRL